jgi:hypothetical protein
MLALYLALTIIVNEQVRECAIGAAEVITGIVLCVLGVALSLAVVCGIPFLLLKMIKIQKTRHTSFPVTPD